MKSTSEYSSFEALDIRVGKIIQVDIAETRKPTYRITVDFGEDIGQKVSCGAYRNYSKDELIGRLVVGIVNFKPMKMGPETSEVLILGVPNDKRETIYLTPESSVPSGVRVF